MSLRFGPLLLAAVALLGTAAVASAGAPASPAQASGALAAEEPLAANATIEIRLRPDGDARWTVTTWFDLDGEIDRATYGQLADRFEDGEVSALGLSTFRRARAAASRATGREMAIRDVSRSTSPAAEVENGTGRLAVSFTWTNFARVADNGTMAVGDAFRAGNETWFSGLTANQTLVVTPPEGYSVTSSTVPVTDGSLRWEGPRTFEPGALSATFVGGNGPQEPPTGGTPWLVIVGGLAVVLLAAAVVALLLARDRGWIGGPAPDAAAGGGVDEPDAATEAADDAGGVDVDLLSDEERVERLLDSNGGRMKQANIVKETGWSNAKVSQLLSAMEEEDRIDKLRIGRENLISFPDEDVADVDE